MDYWIVEKVDFNEQVGLDHQIANVNGDVVTVFCAEHDEYVYLLLSEPDAVTLAAVMNTSYGTPKEVAPGRLN